MTEDTHSLYQHGTLALLVPGLYTGTEAVGTLLQHGDTGIGTLAGLDGELIIEDGVTYQVNATGAVRTVDPAEMVPFANVHYADFSPAGTIHAASYQATQAAITRAMGSTNLFVAVRLRGQFSAVKTRAISKQQPPYAGLAAMATRQHEFTAARVSGSVIGYYSPQVYAGAVSPGFHLHFLSAGHDFGGHILDLTVQDAQLELQKFSDFHLHLPADDQAFLQQDFAGDLRGDIDKAEN